ncbi:peptide/nickel transport system permease protein [Kribbella sp. VKM Ac-2527]|uniref:Peptide/nickel transport system permease protein n=1 Tax=Kribbella caucasensis TaxID=2512215 RepID=A0A4R6K895_9ACTN|nr:ABC transporter permease [Kribbella sp. VKM Ac-2527]TDO45774.1 peptide/nickel transport system permease protein [Kribbella sp. VKM Ac-2527]
MLRYILKRLAASVPMMLVASFAVFCLVALSGDPLARLREQPGVSAEAIAARSEALNLDQPLIVRYLGWITNVLQGNLGLSLDGEPVADKLTRAFSVTLRLVIAAAVVAILLAVVVGVLSAVRRYTVWDYSATFAAFVFFSMPVFFLAGVLKDLAIRLNEATGHVIFTTVGERGSGAVTGLLDTISDRAGHMVLPTLTLVLVTFAAWSRYQRASMLEILGADFMRTARAKGVPERSVLLRHGLRNALIPLTTIVAVDFATLVNGSIVIETVYAWNGLGRLFITSLQQGDVQLSTAWLLIAAGAVVVFNLVADIVYALLDPRIRHA